MPNISNLILKNSKNDYATGKKTDTVLFFAVVQRSLIWGLNQRAKWHKVTSISKMGSCPNFCCLVVEQTNEP